MTGQETEAKMGLYIAGFGVFFPDHGRAHRLCARPHHAVHGHDLARVPMTLIYQQLYQAVDNFVLLAIPLFMLAAI